MLTGWFIIVASFAYLCILFAIAYYVDKRADEGRSLLVSKPYIYTLSLAVYCTSWTYYGSVGRAASSGIGFLPIYLGPTLVFVLWWFVLRKIIRISKAHRITSIADFISSRFGKSTRLGVLVTVIAVVGIIPYISLQLKAVSNSFYVLLDYPAIVMPPPIAERVSLIGDVTFLIALVLAVFAILFGTRHIDASEHHEGMVAAVAFESVIKLIAFLSVGIFVTFGLYDGFGDLFSQAALEPAMDQLFTMEGGSAYSQWVTLTLLSMAAIICLPRQFQVTVVENVNEDHLAKAVWLFPLYLLLINIFVLPIAIGGLLTFPDGTVDADTFVLALPMADKQEFLAIFVFLGGLSAATGMVIVATITLSTMVCNDLLMPALLRIKWLRLNERGDLSGLLLFIRRASIVGILLLGYAYFRFIGESDALVTIGLVSFAAAAQFAPPIIGGIFWKGASRDGAFAGLTMGFLVWGYTLMLPFFARPGWLSIEFIDSGPFGIALLKPYELFGLSGLDSLSHAMFWSMLANIGSFVAISLWSRQTPIERVQAVLFVDVFRWSGSSSSSQFWRGSATIPDLYGLVVRFIGQNKANRAFADYARQRQLDLGKLSEADADLVSFTERLLAGAIGAASARVMVGTVAKGEVVGLEEVMEILDETSQVIEYSHSLEQKSHELEAKTAELREANERLKELDRLKDDFLSTVSHELRTPLTSIRSFSEILVDHREISNSDRDRFLRIIVKESERLTRLINQILELAKMEAGNMDWEMADLDPRGAIEDALASTGNLFAEDSIDLDVKIEGALPRVHADRDRLIQVIVNLLSNAAKFCDREAGRVTVRAGAEEGNLRVTVADNGRGIELEDRRVIFERFRQANKTMADRPGGTGLGLAISRQIVEFFGGRIWVDSSAGTGARITFEIPAVPVQGARALAPAVPAQPAQ
jgi:Na+/proline symporter/nitrogen-specific signal transduction histidine kinase